MKNFKLFCLTVLSLGLVIISCEEEERGPLVIDGDSPNVITDVTVENLPGGAIIKYKLPQDEDALLVEASYERNGEMISARSSIFKNFVSIEGLKETSPQDVELVVVDRSNNKSTPVKVTINPETAPIDKLFSSFELVPDFGGVRLKYNNEDNIKAEILLYAADPNGNISYNQSAFIDNDNRSHFTYRTFSPTLQSFGVAAIDRWNNITNIKQSEVLPLEEIQLDIQNFDNLFLNGDRQDAFGWIMSNMWNGSIEGGGFHTSQTEPGVTIAPYDEPYHMFTMDLGVKAKLSRFKFWQRQGSWIFTHGNPRYFEVWGIDELPADNGDSFDGWTRLIQNGEVIKPSGGAIGLNSAEDAASAASGEEFEFPIDAPPVRYIRFVNLKNWSEGKFMHIMEINFWGQLAD